MSFRTIFRGERMARTLFFALALIFASSDVRADGVNIESDNPAKGMKVEVDKATISDVLQALHEKYGVELAGSLDADSDAPMSGTFQGHLPGILERLLRNQNYMLVRSRKNPTGVEKILIAVPGSKTPKTPPAPAPGAPAMP